MRTFDLSNPADRRAFERRLASGSAPDPGVMRDARRIVDDVRRRGDAAVSAWTRRLDGFTAAPPFVVPARDLQVVAQGAGADGGADRARHEQAVGSQQTRQCANAAARAQCGARRRRRNGGNAALSWYKNAPAPSPHCVARHHVSVR